MINILIPERQIFKFIRIMDRLFY